MNKKERQRRFWKESFKRQYQKKIWQTIEYDGGLEPEFGCFYIAHLAERLSQGRLKLQIGILSIDYPWRDPFAGSHCWNVYANEIMDISPWGEVPYPSRYTTPDDGNEYIELLKQTTPLSIASREVLNGEIEHLLKALHKRMSIDASNEHYQPQAKSPENFFPKILA